MEAVTLETSWYRKGYKYLDNTNSYNTWILKIHVNTYFPEENSKIRKGKKKNFSTSPAATNKHWSQKENLPNLIDTKDYETGPKKTTPT